MLFSLCQQRSHQLGPINLRGAPTGFTAQDLKEGGKAYAQWPALQKDLVARAEKSISLSAR